jgi:hypothetical protein
VSSDRVGVLDILRLWCPTTRAEVMAMFLETDMTRKMELLVI